MESLVTPDLSRAFKNKRVLITGHTGFKGSWLAAWLKILGADVTGISLAPTTTPNHWSLLNLDIQHHIADILDAQKMNTLIKNAAPDIVFHLAAQSLVRRSYKSPVDTWATNVMGTAHVLEACRATPSIRAIVAITTDKCYENIETNRGYREDDRLGGHDPYSASKAAMEILCASYRKSFLQDNSAPLLATARAGNVIGGGDWAEDRLIPDLVRALAAKKPLVIRSPQSTRPWQHVLEPLVGYMMLGARLLAGEKNFATPFNFGPDSSGNQTVETVLNILKAYWTGFDWVLDAAPQPHEAKLLHLDSTKAHQELHWHPVWNLQKTLQATAEWYQACDQGRIITTTQINDYMRDRAARLAAA